jgi:hypothetical protein
MREMFTEGSVILRPTSGAPIALAGAEDAEHTRVVPASGRIAHWRRWDFEIGRGLPQNKPNPEKWPRAIAKETEPRYPSLRCALRYWLAMPPPAYPVAVPMPAAPVANTPAVAMVPMLDELSRCLPLRAL